MLQREFVECSHRNGVLAWDGMSYAYMNWCQRVVTVLLEGGQRGHRFPEFMRFDPNTMAAVVFDIAGVQALLAEIVAIRQGFMERLMPALLADGDPEDIVEMRFDDAGRPLPALVDQQAGWSLVILEGPICSLRWLDSQARRQKVEGRVLETRVDGRIAVDGAVTTARLPTGARPFRRVEGVLVDFAMHRREAFDMCHRLSELAMAEGIGLTIG